MRAAARKVFNHSLLELTLAGARELVTALNYLIDTADKG
jgi:hypothetical protein